MNTRERGELSELIALCELRKRGKRVALPFGNAEGFDILVETSEGWKAIQVKTAYIRGTRRNRIYVDTIRGTSLNKKRGYKDGAFDYLLAILPESYGCWVIPFSEMRGRRCMTLGNERLPMWQLLD